MFIVRIDRNITKEKELDRMKDDFLSMASHELRTPMTAIKGFVSMILEGDYGEVNAKQKDPLKNVQMSTERLIELVNDLLNISRMEQSRVRINLQNIEPAKITKEVVDSLTPVAIERKLKLYVKEVEEGEIQADPDKLREILINLIGNSLKFTEKGEIYLRQIIRDGFAKFSVVDTGIGISDGDKDKIFGKFVQVYDQGRGKPKGTGLGLYISKLLVEKMGGKMWVEETKLGKGSTFSFTLPLSSNKISLEVKKEIEKEKKDNPNQKDLAK